MKCKTCFKCGGMVDKSDCAETFITITSKWFMFLPAENVTAVKIPGKRILLCGNCGLGIIHEIEEEVENKKYQARFEAKEAGA